MSNPFYQAMGGNVNPLGNFGQLVQKFQQFKTSFQGDPKAEVEKMLQSGALTQEQLNRAQAMARQFQNLSQLPVLQPVGKRQLYRLLRLLTTA